MKLYISKATLRTIEKFGNASLTHISATPSDHMSVELDATPLANEASKPAVQTLSDGAQFFACYLIDNCENEVVREESVQAWLGKMLASPRYHPAAPSVEQDEVSPIVAPYANCSFRICDLPGQCRSEGKCHHPRAASTSANVAQEEAAAWFYYEDDEFIRMYDSEEKAVAACEKFGGHWEPVFKHPARKHDRFDPYRLKVAEECCERLMSACTDAGCPDGVRMDDWIRENVRPTSANVAQGAEAVATVKVYETYTGQNGWIEVTQEEYDRTKDKYEHRIRRVSAPPAQTALTDDARDVLAERCRQVEAEGFTTARDDGYADGQLAQAGAAYALAVADHTNHTINSGAAFYTRSPDIWPWSEKWWKPTSPRRALVKAGALILAEIERLDRRALTAAQSASGDKS